MEIPPQVPLLDINENAKFHHCKTINDLPDEMLLKILSHFGPEELCLKLSNVCSRWYILCHDITLWKSLAIHCYKFSELSVVCKLLEEAPALDTLELHGRDDADKLLTYIYESCDSLKKLVLNLCCLGESGAILLERIHKHFPTLQSLCLNGCQPMVTSNYELIAQCVELTSLDLSHSKGLDGHALCQIAKSCRYLTELRLDDVVNIYDGDIIYVINELKDQLTALVLDGEELTDASFVKLAECTKLSVLEISFCEEMTDRGLLEGVGALSRLHSLRLKRGTRITKLGVYSYFSEMSVSNLLSLNLSESTNVDDDSLIAIALRCPLLNFLKLQWCWEITDIGVEKILKHCNLLVTLDLTGVVLITGYNYVNLICKHTPCLKKLNLESCNNFFDEALLEIHMAKPDLEVTNYYGTRIVSALLGEEEYIESDEDELHVTDTSLDLDRSPQPSSETTTVTTYSTDNKYSSNNCAH